MNPDEALLQAMKVALDFTYALLLKPAPQPEEATEDE